MSISPITVQRDRRQRELWDRTAEVAGRLNRVQAELVDIATELLEGRHWGDGGFRSPEHYLVVRAALSPARARDVVAVARRRAELPVVAEAVSEGVLSLDQAAVVAHHVPVSHQRSVGELARHLTVPQLRRAVSRHAFAVARTSMDQEPGELSGGDGEPRAEEVPAVSEAERRACARPELSMSYDRDGRFQLRYSAPATVGALVEQAVREAKDALFLAARAGADHGQDERARASAVAGPWPSHAEAFEEIARRSLDTLTSSSRSSHYRVYVHLSTDGAWVNGRGAIPLALVERLLVNGAVQPVWETDGKPVAVGRSMRILPDRARRLVEDRDRGCRFPGCTATRFVEVHHLVRWAEGGATDPGNQACLCTFHHDAIDRGDYTVEGDPGRLDGLVVRNRYGLVVGPPVTSGMARPPGIGRQQTRVGRGATDRAPTAYRPPTGEAVRWADLELGPDDSLPPPG
ncbi:hypothetical protein GCM10027517_37350 [Phycicoccus ginsengisoli]